MEKEMQSRNVQTREFVDLRSGLITQKYTQIKHEKEFKYNAPHRFKVERMTDRLQICSVHFQEGPIKEAGVNGVCNEDLIAMVVKRLESFQESEYKCKENEKALEKLQEALMWLRKRTSDREARNVEGTHQV